MEKERHSVSDEQQAVTTATSFSETQSTASTTTYNESGSIIANTHRRHGRQQLESGSISDALADSAAH